LAAETNTFLAQSSFFKPDFFIAAWTICASFAAILTANIPVNLH
jgi:hypothetical protein